MSEASQAMMIPIPISEIINGTILPVDLFVLLGDNKFILIAKSGTKTDHERLNRFENHTVTHLWVKQVDYNRFVQNNITIAGILVKQPRLDAKQKTSLLTNVAQAVFRDLEGTGINADSFRHARQVVESTVTLCDNHRDLQEMLDGLKDCGDMLLRHSMAVCAVSTLISYAMKWDSRTTIEKLALGALLHDIGKKALPAELITKPRGLMSNEEQLAYESHPFKGMQMLQSLGVVPDDVISIVYEHHENSIGQGFPRRLRNLKIHPLARIVGLADDFINLVMPVSEQTPPKSPREALMHIETTMGQPHNKEAFKALQTVVTKEFARTSAVLN